VNLSQIAQDLKAHFEDTEAKAKSWLEEKLPEFADLAEKAGSNELVDAALNAVHLSPALLSGLAAAVRQADADLAASLPAAPEPAAAEPVVDDQGPAGVPDVTPVG
jgi:hypothetical protein